jgi:hypothetical protein
MKRTISISLLAMLPLFMLITCLSPFEGNEGDGGTVTITVGTSSNSRIAWNGIETDQLTHIITVTDSSGKVQNITLEPGVSSAPLPSLSIGSCKIVVEGWLNGALKSRGTTTVNVKPGKNDTAPVTMGQPTPIASDYTFGNLHQTAGSVTAVTITAKEGRSSGIVNNIRYAGNAEIPQTAGTYAVTFDVAAATGWNGATGLSAGNLEVTPIFTDIPAFKAWLDAQPPNNAATAYSVRLNVSALGGASDTTGSTGAALRANKNKYVSLDLSSSTMMSIGKNAFIYCSYLTSVTIPGSVASIVIYAFHYCTSLTSVTFAASSNITNFDNSAFPEGPSGDGSINNLRTAYQAANPKEGTYTRAANGTAWARQ